MGSPTYLQFADGTARCMDCKGFGMVRAFGRRAGEHYTTMRGACQAEDAGRAKPCPVCEGSGIVGHLSTRDVMRTWNVDREAVHDDKVQRGVRCAAMSETGYSGSALDRARTPGVQGFDLPVF